MTALEFSPFCAGADNPKLFSTATSDMYMYMPDHKPLASNSLNPRKAISATLIYPAVAQPGKL